MLGVGDGVVDRQHLGADRRRARLCAFLLGAIEFIGASLSEPFGFGALCLGLRNLLLRAFELGFPVRFGGRFRCCLDGHIGIGTGFCGGDFDLVFRLVRFVLGHSMAPQ
ncbi:hypothetical protein [Mesorhizobium sp.]|uniref:hypothetical protein n=1 Tax=Mesorhizobium sp. TaxID=1871066 RepID=UPI000FE6157E|nr:hypothetical protein [Mesorhizobium sp.]RWG97179.1 MAG: hypothetical protein EOQ71_27590 [Mesorhizobium sp.]